MEYTEEKTQQNPAVDESVKKIALRAAYWFLLVFALLCTLFYAFFPYTSMRIYSNIGARGKLFDTAERIVKRQGDKPAAYDSKYAEALYFAADLSAVFMNQKISKKGYNHNATLRAAEKTIKYADIYFERDYFLRDRRLESDSITGLPADYHAQLYRYRNSVRTGYVQARYIKNVVFDQDPGQYMQDFAGFNTLMSDEPLPAGKAERESDMDEYCGWLNELNAVLNLELDKVGYHYIRESGDSGKAAYIYDNRIKADGHFRLVYSKTSFTAGQYYEAGKRRPLLAIESKLENIKDYIERYPHGGNKEKLLRRAYWAWTVSLLTANIRTVTEIFYGDRGVPDTAFYTAITQMHDDWASIYDNFHIGGADYPLTEWYRQVIFKEYKNAL